MGAVLLVISALWLLAFAGEMLFFESQRRSYKFSADSVPSRIEARWTYQPPSRSARASLRIVRP